MPEMTLEFVAVCDDYAALKIITSAVQQLRGHLHCAPNSIAAQEFIERRKLDGIIVDLALERGIDLIKLVRNGRSNRQSVLFACFERRTEAAEAITAGANFVFRKPLVEESLVQVLQAAASMMNVERRRYFRYEITTPVQISCAGGQYKAVISNLSETGMAVRSSDSLPPGTTVDFSFGLPGGPIVRGKGEVIWSNTAGGLGIQFRFLADTAPRELPQWLSARDK